MNSSLTEMVMVIDRSGSMYSRAKDATEGINSLIQENKDFEGNVVFTLVEFDDYSNTVYYREPINNIDEYVLKPRNRTALLDTVGITINQIGDSLSKINEEDRPGLVLFCIVTDGLENASKEFTLDQVKNMIQHQQDVYNWQFTYLGANQDAFKTGGYMGIHQAGTQNYSKSKEAYESTSTKFVRMRSQTQQGVSVDNSYTTDEVTAMT